MPHIEVRAVDINDAPALCALDYDFETDTIYMLRVHDRLLQNNHLDEQGDQCAFTFELVQTQVDPPIYKNYHEQKASMADVEAHLRSAEGGFVALVNGEVAGGIFLNIDRARHVADIQDMIVGRQFRRYGVGSLLLSCASDWARHHKCWAIVLETQNTNYPAIQFYLRNGLRIWSIGQNFYPPGPTAHEVAIFMGKRVLLPGAEE